MAWVRKVSMDASSRYVSYARHDLASAVASNQRQAAQRTRRAPSPACSAGRLVGLTQHGGHVIIRRCKRAVGCLGSGNADIVTC